MTTRTVLLIPAALLILGGSLLPALAHDPHPPGPSPQLAADSDAPRRISDQTAQLIGLQTAEADFGHAESVVRLTGFVRPLPERTRIVSSAVAGTLVSIEARLGERIRRGKVLGRVQSTDLARLVTDLHKAEIEFEHTGVEIVQTKANIAQVRNQITASEAQAASLEAEYARAQASAETIPPNILSNRKTSAQQARAQVTTLGVSLDTAEHTLTALEKMRASTQRTIATMRESIEIIRARAPGGDPAEPARNEGDTGGTFTLYAPIDGVVVRRDGVAGQGLEAGKAILTIVDDSEMLIEGDLPESMIATFASRLGDAVFGPSLAVRIRRTGAAAGDEPLATGRVIGISPTVDPVKRTAHLLVSAPNTVPVASPGGAPVEAASPVAPRPAVPAALQEGMFVSLSITERAPGDDPASRTVVIPRSALLSDGPVVYVFLKEKDGYVKRTILPGPSDDRNVEVIDGVVPGDVVVTQGAYLLGQVQPR